MPLIERWREDLRSPTTAAAPPLALRHPTLSPSAAADSIWNMESVSQRGTYATPRKPAAPRSVSLERPTKESASARAMSHTRTGSSTSSSSSASSTRKPRSPARPSPRRARPPATAPAYPYATPQLRYDYGVPLSPMQPVYPAPPTPASYELEKPNWPDRRYERAQEDAKRDRTARRKRRCFFVAGGLLLLVALGLGLGLGLRSKAPGEVHAGGEGEGLQLARPPSRTAISAGGIAASEVKPVERQPARTADQVSMPSRAANPPATSSATAPKEEEKEEPAKPAPVANVAAPAPAPASEKTFFGIGYDQCMSGADTTVDNLAILVKLTNRLRLYGTTCQQVQFLFDAIDKNADAKSMQIWLTVEYLGDEAAYATSSVLVGDNYVQSQADKTAASNTLVDRMKDVRAAISILKLDKAIPVGTAEAGNGLTATIMAGADLLMPGIQAWFSTSPVADAAKFTNDNLNNDVLPALAKAKPDYDKKNVFVGELGFPSGSDSGSAVSTGGSPANIASLQRYMDDFVCAANKAGTQYFWYAAFDQEWKKGQSDVANHWGFYDRYGALKSGVKVPTC